MLLKVGRHIRPTPEFKLIIARDAGESKFLEGYRKQFASIYATSHSGPMALVDGDLEPEQYELAAAIVARYGQGRNADEVELSLTIPDRTSQKIKTAPMDTKAVMQEWYV